MRFDLNTAILGLHPVSIHSSDHKTIPSDVINPPTGFFTSLAKNIIKKVNWLKIFTFKGIKKATIFRGLSAG